MCLNTILTRHIVGEVVVPHIQDHGARWESVVSFIIQPLLLPEKDCQNPWSGSRSLIADRNVVARRRVLFAASNQRAVFTLLMASPASFISHKNV